MIMGVQIALMVPLACALLIMGVSLVRLEVERRGLVDGKARVASGWLSDLIALTARSKVGETLEGAAGAMGAVAGMYDTDGSPIVAGALDGIPPETLSEILSGEIEDVELGARIYRAAAAPLRPPLGGLNVIVAFPVDSSGVGLGVPMARMGIIALILLLGVAAYGIGLGRAFGVRLADITGKLDRLGGDGEGARGKAAGTASSMRELHNLDAAVERLGSRFGEEMAIVSDQRRDTETRDRGETDLLTSVSGDLCRPLDRVVSLSDRLLAGEDGPLSESQREDVSIVRKAGGRLTTMVSEILDLSSLMGADGDYDDEAVDLVEVAREVVETSRGEAVKKNLTVDLEGAPDGPVWVRGNRQRLWQVLTNLVSNGIKFTESGGVAVEVGVEEDSARLVVKDTGVGIARLDQATVFDTFRQIGARTGRNRGTGLGLAICRRLVELHGGKIRVSSVIGEGTRFTVTLPVMR